MLFEVTMLIDLDLEANFIASDSVKTSLEELLQDTIYDIDELDLKEIEVKEK